MKIHEFDKSIKNIGDVGEKIIYKYLKKLPSVTQIKDVRDTKKFQELDIDFLVKLKDGRKVSIELKTDSYESPNIFYETMSCIETGSLGCMLKTRATYLFYFFIKTGELYIFQRRSFNKWFNKNSKRFKIVFIKNRRYNGGIYTSKGHLIKKRTIEKEFKYYKKKHLKRKRRY